MTTRTSAIRVTTTGADQPPLVVTIKVPFPSTVLACLPISYLNHAFSLLSATHIQRLQTTLQSKKVHFCCAGFPLRWLLQFRYTALALR